MINEELLSILEKLQEGDKSIVKAHNEVLDLFIVSKWRPISSIEGYEWITATKNNIRVKLSNGIECLYNDDHGDSEITHVAFC